MSPTNLADDPMADDEWQTPAQEFVPPILFSAANHTKAFFQLSEETMDIGWYLQIAIHIR